MINNRSKYDTDPLDPEFLRRTEHLRASETAEFGQTATAESHAAETSSETEIFSDAPTQRYADAYAKNTEAISSSEATTLDLNSAKSSFPRHGDDDSYNSSLNNSYKDAHSNSYNNSHTPPASDSRAVKGIGLPENIVMMVPYVPMFVGAVAAIVELLIVPRTEQRVRFHAAQALALHVGVFLLGLLLRVSGGFAGVVLGGFGSFLAGAALWLLSIGSTILFIVMMVRAWQGTIAPIESLKEITRLINEKIEPQR